MAFHVAYDSGELKSTGLALDLTYDYESLVMEVCTALAEAPGGRFTLSGFGRDPWPVSVDYDMSVFVEQLPDLLKNLESGDLFRLDMYAQGIESMFEFSPDGDQVTITCSSRTGWGPDPGTERADRRLLLETLRRLAVDFALAARTVDPALAAVQPFDRWLTWAGARSQADTAAGGTH